MTERRAYISVVCAESLAQAESSGQGSFFSPVVDGSNTTKLSSTCQHGFRSDSSASGVSMAGRYSLLCTIYVWLQGRKDLES